MGINKKDFDCTYNLDKDILNLEMGHGLYKVKIENNELLENIHNIASLIIKELRSVEEKQKASGANLSHYAKLLLATLNICEKHTRLERKYAEIRHVVEELQGLKSELKRAMTPRAATNATSSKHQVHVEPQGRTAVKQERGGTPPAHGLKASSAQPAEKPMPAVTSEKRAISDKKMHVDHAERKETAERPATSDASSQPVLTSATSVVPPSLARSSYTPFSLSDTANLESPAQHQDSSQSRELRNAPSQVRVSFETSSISKRIEVPQPAVSTTHVASESPSIPVSSRNEDILTGSSDILSSGDPKKDDTDASCAEKSEVPDSYGLREGTAAGSTSVEPEETVKTLPHQNQESAENSVGQFRERSTAQSLSIPAVSPTVPTAVRGDEMPVAPEAPHQSVAGSEMTESAAVATGHMSAEPNDMAGTDRDVCDPPLPEAAEATELSGNWAGHDVDLVESSCQRHAPVVLSDEYQLPLFSFLRNGSCENLVDQDRIRSDAELLETKLGYFGIKGEVMGIHPGPVITTYEYKPDPGIKISKIVNLADDLALALSAYSIRIVAPIPGKDVMGIEIPNPKKDLVPFFDIVTSTAFGQSTSKIPICLGKDIVGNPVVVELDTMPHLLIAGATGTGKSVGLNAMITSILYKSTPDEVRFLMIDPKRIELSYYNDIGHLLTPVITDMNKANTALQWLVREMDRRYSLLAEYQVRHIEQFNQKLAASDTPLHDENGEILESLPYIVVIIDELADLMMTASRDIEFSLTRLAQMARAAGIHLILATQRPSVDVLTGIIKANFPTRISFQVSSKTDSRTIIDSNGAETLLGNGDMLFVPPGTARLTRVHGTYLSEEELVAITTFIKQQRKPDYIFDVLSEQNSNDADTYDNQDRYDEKYDEALDYVMTTRQASISGVQRALRVGYNRAARIIDLMEKNGVVGPSDGVRPRKVLVNNANMM